MSSDIEEKNSSNFPVEPDFYYNKEGLMVFTRSYHLRRGYCCKSGCLHCPYGFRQQENTIE
ncbi:MAG: hypothetical protein HY390_05570 [Deltaproteobacteria bacterium]|nr:hypothetical protein [Deltaproteobacteria bacterium]